MVVRITAHNMYLRSTLIKRSGLNANNVLTTPDPMSQAVSGPPTTFWPACPITNISTALHPTHCAMLKNVGTYDPRLPKIPRIITIEGTPVIAPIFATPPRTAEPRTSPNASAQSAAVKAKLEVPSGC